MKIDLLSFDYLQIFTLKILYEILFCYHCSKKLDQGKLRNLHYTYLSQFMVLSIKVI